MLEPAHFVTIVGIQKYIFVQRLQLNACYHRRVKKWWCVALYTHTCGFDFGVVQMARGWIVQEKRERHVRDCGFKIWSHIATRLTHLSWQQRREEGKQVRKRLQLQGWWGRSPCSPQTWDFKWYFLPYSGGKCILSWICIQKTFVPSADAAVWPAKQK